MKTEPTTEATSIERRLADGRRRQHDTGPDLPRDRSTPAIAARVLEQEQDVHRLHSELARMAEMEVTAQSKLMADIDRVLSRALGEE